MGFSFGVAGAIAMLLGLVSDMLASAGSAVVSLFLDFVARGAPSCLACNLDRQVWGIHRSTCIAAAA